jgi:peroxiredoxin
VAERGYHFVMRRPAAAIPVLCALFAGSTAAYAAGTEVATARPWIGIGVEEGAKGVKVNRVLEETPAERAGLQTGDEVLTIDGAAVKLPQDLISKVQDKGVGEKVTLVLDRAGKSVTVTLALEAKPDEVQFMRSRLVDKSAPAFDLSAVSGPHTPKLSSLTGNVVVIEFWATWCGPCNASLPKLNAWHDKYAKQGLRVVGISTEDTATLSKFAGDKKIKYTIAADADKKVTEAYHVPSIPTIVVIDKKGVVRYAGVGTGDNLSAAEAVIQSLLK